MENWISSRTKITRINTEIFRIYHVSENVISIGTSTGSCHWIGAWDMYRNSKNRTSGWEGIICASATHFVMLVLVFKYQKCLPVKQYLEIFSFIGYSLFLLTIPPSWYKSFISPRSLQFYLNLTFLLLLDSSPMPINRHFLVDSCS